MKKKRFNTMELFCAAISIGAFLCLWNFGVTGDLGRLMPGPIPVLRKFFETLFGGRIGSKTLIMHVVYSLLRVMAGYFIGAAVGVVLGLSMGWSRLVEAVFSPVFRIIRPIPPIAWIPISIVWIGLGRERRYF